MPVMGPCDASNGVRLHVGDPDRSGLRNESSPTMIPAAFALWRPGPMAWGAVYPGQRVTVHRGCLPLAR